MESLSNLNEESKLEFSSIVTKHVEDIAKWAKFLSIVGFIGVGFLILVAIVMTFLPSINAGNEFSQEFQNADTFPSFMGPVLSIIYFLAAILYFMPVYYLYNFSRKAIQAIRHHDTITIEDSFNNLRRHYKFMGILVIIMLGIYAIGFIGLAMGGMMGAMM